MLDSTSPPTFVTTPHRPSANVGNTPFQLRSIKPLVSESSSLYLLVRDVHDAVESVECPTVIAV